MQAQTFTCSVVLCAVTTFVLHFQAVPHHMVPTLTFETFYRLFLNLLHLTFLVAYGNTACNPPICWNWISKQQTRWADLWLGDLLLRGFTHLNAETMFTSHPLTSLNLFLVVDVSWICYVEFLPEHSLMFSNVLNSHVTPFHRFHPNSPLQNINTLRFP